MKFKSKCTCLLRSIFSTVNMLMFQCSSILLVTCLLSYTQASKCTGTENGRLWLSREGSTERAGRGHEKAHRFVGTTRGHQWSWEEIRFKLSLTYWPLYVLTTPWLYWSWSPHFSCLQKAQLFTCTRRFTIDGSELQMEPHLLQRVRMHWLYRTVFLDVRFWS